MQKTQISPQKNLEKNYEAFLRMNLQEYSGQWIAISQGKIVSHGIHMEEVFDQAQKNSPEQRPLLARVPNKTAMIF